jgi:hypothetical protein
VTLCKLSSFNEYDKILMIFIRVSIIIELQNRCGKLREKKREMRMEDLMKKISYAFLDNKE